jgi:hypothetical protein
VSGGLVFKPKVKLCAAARQRGCSLTQVQPTQSPGYRTA